MNRGNYKYNPKELLDELDEIKINCNIKKDADAFKKIAEFSSLGRELNNALSFYKMRRRK